MSVSESQKDPGRKPQLAYSEIQEGMHDEAGRRVKANKIIQVLHDFLGRSDLNGLRALDIGCSTGIIANELALDGAVSVGVDIDTPGLRKAAASFGETVVFCEGAGDHLPFADESFDVVVFNQIYEHVVDPEAVVGELRRVLRDTGAAYLGLGNKFQLMEPHYRLPLLSWLPKAAADRYVRQAGRAEEYYEKHRSRRGLMQLFHGFHIYDYTIPIIRHPEVFGSGDQVAGTLSRLPTAAVRAAYPVIPTYIWIGCKRPSERRSAVAPAELVHLDLTEPGRARTG